MYKSPPPPNIHFYLPSFSFYLFSFTFQKKKNLGGGGATWSTHPLSKKFTIFPPPPPKHPFSSSFSFYRFSFIFQNNYYSIFFWGGGGFKPPGQLICVHRPTPTYVSIFLHFNTKWYNTLSLAGIEPSTS